jgi:hypothetical protein
MILDINLPQRWCFVGLVQRSKVFSSINKGFTLIFLQVLAKFEFVLKTTCYPHSTTT